MLLLILLLLLLLGAAAAAVVAAAAAVAAAMACRLRRPLLRDIAPGNGALVGGDSARICASVCMFN